MKKRKHTGHGHRFTGDETKKMSVITFGDPEPVLTNILDYSDVWYDNTADYYQTPIERRALAQLPNMNGQHGGILYARMNMISGGYRGGGLSHQQVEALLLDYLIFGDVALLKLRNAFGEVIGLHPLPSLYLRVKKDGRVAVLQKGEPLIYEAKDVIFIRKYDPQQQVYGLPDYLGGVHSAMLNMEATLFRRRYYNNGAHMGYVFYATDPNLSDEMEGVIREKIEKSKGVGNFRSMFINIPNGQPDGIKIIQVGDSGAKDEYANIKNISAQDIFTAHRFPPGLSGIIPTNTAGLGDPSKTYSTYARTEVYPVRRLFMDAINAAVPDVLQIKFFVPKEKDEDKEEIPTEA